MPVGVAAGAAVGGAVIGGVASNKAAKSAAKAQTQAAQTVADNSLDVAKLNNALHEKIYNQNLGVLGPYAALGLPAGTMINDLLGLPTSPATGALAQYGNGPAVAAGAPIGSPVTANPTPSTPAQTGPTWEQTAMQALLGDLSGSGNESRGYKTSYRNFVAANPIKYAADGKLDPAWSAAALAAVKPDLEKNLSEQPDRDISRTYQSLLSSKPAVTAPATAAPAVPSAHAAAAPAAAPMQYNSATGTTSVTSGASDKIAGGALSAYSEAPMNRAQAAINKVQARIAERVGTTAPAAIAAAPVAAVPGPAVTAAPATSTSAGALDAFAKFRAGTNYQWRLGEGLDSLQSGFAARGALDSGAATKAAIAFNQNLASEELGNYMNLLAGQQAMGLSAAGAVAGVGTNYAGNVTSQNTNASNAASNAALMAGQAQAMNPGMGSQLGGAIGGALMQWGQGQMAQGFPKPAGTPSTPPMNGYNVTPNYPIPWGGGF